MGGLWALVQGPGPQGPMPREGHSPPRRAWIHPAPQPPPLPPPPSPAQAQTCLRGPQQLQGGALSCFQSSLMYFVFNFNKKGT